MAAPSLGNAAHATGTSTPATVTISTAGSSGVLAIAITINSSVDLTGVVSASSTTLGSWSQRGFDQANTGQAIFTFTKPFTSQLTSEIITVSTSSGTTSFITIDAFEIENAAISSYFDPHSGLPVQVATNPTTVSTTDSNDFIFAGWRSLDQNSTAGTGFTLISGADYQNVEYKIVSSAQTNLSVDLTNTNGSNGGIVDAIVAATAPDIIAPALFRLRGRRWD